MPCLCTGEIKMILNVKNNYYILTLIVLFAFRDTKSLDKETPSKLLVRRRNTLDSIIFNEMCDKADRDCENEANQDMVKEGSRKCKRIFKVLRGSERDLKLDMKAAYDYAEKFDHGQVSTPNHIKVETRNRFRCLRSKPVDVEERKVETDEPNLIIDDNSLVAQSPKTLSLKEREIFHDTFSFLIRLVPFTIILY